MRSWGEGPGTQRGLSGDSAVTTATAVLGAHPPTGQDNDTTGWEGRGERVSKGTEAGEWGPRGRGRGSLGVAAGARPVPWGSFGDTRKWLCGLTDPSSSLEWCGCGGAGPRHPPGPSPRGD